MNRKNSTRFEPPRNAQARLVTQQDFVFDLAASEKNTFAHGRCDELGAFRSMDAKFSAMSVFPRIVEIHHHRKSAGRIVAKLVYMALVKCSGLVKRIVKFIARDGCKTGPVEIEHKIVDQIKKQMFFGRIVLSVEPVYLIATHRRIVRLFGVVSDSGFL